MGFHPHSKRWLPRHVPLAGRESATQAAGSACRNREGVRYSDGLSRIDLMCAQQQRAADAMPERQRAAVAQLRQLHADERQHKRQRAVELQRAAEPQRRHLCAGGLFETGKSDSPTQGPPTVRTTTAHLGGSRFRPAAQQVILPPSATRVSSPRPGPFRHGA